MQSWTLGPESSPEAVASDDSSSNIECWTNMVIPKLFGIEITYDSILSMFFLKRIINQGKGGWPSIQFLKLNLTET